MQWNWTSGRHSTNQKTGPIPTAYPASRDDAWESCQGCPLRDWPEGLDVNERNRDRSINNVCYFWYGQSKGVITILNKAKAKGRDYSIQSALANAPRQAKAVRMSGGGDPSATDPIEYHAMRAHAKGKGFAWLDYTHFWHTRGAWLKGVAMASCDTVTDAIDAVSKGWRATVHVPHWPKRSGKFPGTNTTYAICPAQTPSAKTCNQCGVCDASKPGPDVIVFLNH